jgi:aspartyl-tRNA(Asn)/glutamyl-tRNA(Gln) amidotransferase subunit A
MSDLHTLGVAQLSALLQNKDISAVELATRMLARLGGNPHHAFLSVDSEVTLAQAKAADVRIAAGDASPLLGVPIAHKDIFVTTDFPTTAGSRMLEGYRSPFNATVVQRLGDAGMVSLGKLSCDEFAMGSANENVAVPSAKPQAVTNPWDVSCIPGGSSGGSAAAVAAYLTPAATGTDTGGSIRQPAAFLRHHRHQTHLWPRLALRHGGICLQPRPSRPHGPQRRRLRFVVECHVWP